MISLLSRIFVKDYKNYTNPAVRQQYAVLTGIMGIVLNLMLFGVKLFAGIITGAIMAFTLSLDDFVISYFTSGNDFQTLPISIYNMTKKTVTPKMYALATIIFFVTLALLLLNNLVDNDESRRLREKRKQSEGELIND